MESRGDTIRVKEEPSVTWSNVDDDYNLDSVNSWEAKNFDRFSFSELSENYRNEVIALSKKLNEKISIEFECKNVKLELKNQSTAICKTEHQRVKIENENQTNDLNEKKLVILIRKEFNYDKNCQFQVNPRCEIDEGKDVKIFRKNTQIKLLYECKMHKKAYKGRPSLNTHINSTRNDIRLYKCDICHKSFGYQNTLKYHWNVVHDRSKPFKCKICHKSFGNDYTLKNHINALHNRNKPFECDICRTLFGYKSVLKTHISIIHDCCKPFECEICHKSFAKKGDLKTHIMTVHDHSKPFECDICHISFGQKQHLKTHTNAIKSSPQRKNRTNKLKGQEQPYPYVIRIGLRHLFAT
ncbi:zinc finger protein 600-like [Trichogramma pretiosum]|uniref:zinc finger protein 600-like n=1 Tax=Trichogramma pretiosum TaxID=7493 RepID=UPI000C71AB29|nr:zinc finger protein 600-like [Trichogramma pretiosum]